MTYTTIKKLRRVKQMREAKGTWHYWEINPNGHPEPTLPTEPVLRRTYLTEINRSARHLIPEVTELMEYVYRGKERR